MWELGFSIPAEPNSHIDQDGATVARTSATGQPGFWLFIDPARKNVWVSRLEKAGAVAATADEVRLARVENGVPRYGEDFGETTLPQETQQVRALCFTKGCYLGQEIVERIRARGQVNKLAVRLGIEGRQPPEPGAPILAGAQEIGRLSSPVYSPRLGQCLGMGILRREFAGPEAAVTVGQRAARVLATPPR